MAKTERTTLEPIFLMNVVLYITQSDVENFVLVSHKCCDALDRLHVNPWSSESEKSEAVVKKILKYFPKLQTLQIDPKTANTLSDETLANIPRIRIVYTNNKQSHIKNAKVKELSDTVYTIDSKKLETPNVYVVRAFFDDFTELTNLVQFIEEYPNIEFIEIMCYSFEQIKNPIQKLLKRGGIKIHVKFEVSNFTMYDHFEAFRKEVGTTNIYYSFNAIFTNGTYLLVPPDVVAKDLHGIFYGDGEMAHKLYAIKEARISVSDYCNADLRGLTCLTLLEIYCYNKVTLNLPTSLIELNLSSKINVANFSDLKCLKKVNKNEFVQGKQLHEYTLPSYDNSYDSDYSDDYDSDDSDHDSE
ncbi:hypothetical protein EIN_417400 [Entamoeba invadens IP1]|uniref:Uncharacterized protein n=1 Tax=Entamoeba invadens IP1 TaxID=370355 RepID=A0A0A1TWE0_ENTIV|nr:hypothetical protein EIN_417400 [Entamoeba invadens IP1]ELP83631.1 hypothetical protein EIN_417400 [Entamoeba invadens IP1]|eukprot:XP_004182977.1 hypothetical protein EIN_417400 [Entamoeba invadens IP1]